MKARRAANELLDQQGTMEYPVDPFGIAGRLGLGVEESSGFPPRCFGALAMVNGGFRILVSDACPTDELRRFTIGHELGHAAIEGHVDAMEWVSQGSEGTVALSEGHYRSMKNPIEIEADHFASELLMPHRWVGPLVDRLRPGIDSIRAIASAFETSLTSAGVRYAQLSAAPVVIVSSYGDSIEWITASREVQEADFFRCNATRTARLPAGSATRRLGTSPDAVRACREDSSTDYLQDWFPRAPKGVAVEVDAIGLGSYGRVLSLLVCSGLPDPDELYLQEEYGEMGDDTDGDWRTELRRQAGYGDS